MPLEIGNDVVPLDSDKGPVDPSSEFSIGTVDQGQYDINMRTGMPIPKAPMSYAETQIKNMYGDRFSEDSIISGLDDLELGFKLGMSQTSGKKKEILQDLYGPQADLKTYTFSDGSSMEIATKDGKTWHSTSTLYDYVEDLPETAASLATGFATGGAGLATRVIAPALSAGLAEYASEKFLSKYFEQGRKDPVESAKTAFFMDLLGGTVGETVISPIISRTVGVMGSPGAKRAMDAAEAEGLPLPTVGQITENSISMKQYKQWLNINHKSAANALERYEAMRGKLNEMIDTYGLGMFSDTELRTLTDFAAYEIDDTIRLLRTGSTPIGEVMPRLVDALDVFNKTASNSKNQLYRDAFDAAIADGVEFDILPLKNAIADVEKGVPLPGKSGDPVRFLTPNAELSSIINNIKEVSDSLVLHSPDGVDVGSLEQLNTIRRTLSEFAWDNAGDNQGRLATQLLDSIDDIMSKPSYVATVVPGKKPAYQEAWKEAQAANAAWKSIMEIKKISQLNKADLSSYQSYVLNLVKPGNGPLVELMDEMFKGTPGAMDAVKTAYVDHLVKNPNIVAKTIESLKQNDPRLLNKIIDPDDQKTLLNYAELKARYDSSWFAKQAEKRALNEGERAMTIFEGGESAIAQNIDDYLKWGGPNAEEALQAAFLQKMLDASETEVSTLLGSRVVDAGTFVSMLDDNESIINKIFSGKAKERLYNLYNYGLKIKDTAVRIPARKGQVGASDSGTSLMTAQAGAAVSKAPTTLERSGVGGLVGQLFSIFGSPRLMAAILNFDGTLPSGVTTIGEPTLLAVKNMVRVLPDLLVEDEEYTSEDTVVAPTP